MRLRHALHTLAVVLMVTGAASTDVAASAIGQQSSGWPGGAPTTSPAPKKPVADAKPVADTKPTTDVKSSTAPKAAESAEPAPKSDAAPAKADAVKVDVAPQPIKASDADAAAAERDRQVAELERVIEQQGRALDAQTKELAALVARLTPPAQTPATPAPAAAAPAAPAPTSATPAAPASAKPQQASPAPSTPVKTPAATSPTATVTIGGFVDAAAVTRSTNVGSGLGTSFGSIPFANSAAGRLPETRLSAQNSRLSFAAATKVGGLGVKGYFEADFLGQGPTNQFVTSNAATFRMRLGWVQVTSGTAEVVAGQSWSFLTPNRNGLSPTPSDIFFSQNVDTNYQAGLTWGRTNQFRVVFHPSPIVAVGVSAENPEQYVGPAVTLPAAFTAAEVDNGSTTSTPNSYPDIIAKVAFDPKTGATHQHVEFGALVRGFRTFDTTTSTTSSATGTGVAFAANVEPLKNLHLLANGFFADGGGRYIANTNIPDFVVSNDSRVSLVKARSILAGAEAQVSPRTLVYGYFSDVHADANTATDTNGKAIGFGIAAAAAANRRITERTVGITRVFFKDAARGTLQFMAQYSFVERTPFSVAADAPASASAHMVWFNVRYVLPNASIGVASGAASTVAPETKARAKPASKSDAPSEASDADTISPDRPDFTEGADVVGAGRVEVESGVTYGSDAGTRSLTLPNVLVRIGVAPRVEVRVGADGFLSEREAGVSRSGYSDLEASVKVRLLDQRGAGLDVAIVPVVSFPTGAAGFTSGGIDPTVKIAIGRALPYGFGVSGNVNVGSVSDAQGRFSQRAFSVSADHDLAAGWSAFAEAYAVTAGREPGTATTLDWGVARRAGANVQFDIEGGRSLTTNSWFVGGGFSARGLIKGR